MEATPYQSRRKMEVTHSQTHGKMDDQTSIHIKQYEAQEDQPSQRQDGT